MKLLLAEDDVEIAHALRDALESRGHSVQIVRDGSRVVQTVSRVHFTALILDVMLPGLNGFEICRQLRDARNEIPILMLTARDSLQDRVTGLDVGADDYLVKPFAFDELEARLRNLSRRFAKARSSEMHVDDLVIDTVKKTVVRNDRPIALTPREYTLLEALVKNEGAILSKDVISERVWFESMGTPNTVEVHVKNLRKKIDEGSERKLIHTVYGMGYSLRLNP